MNSENSNCSVNSLSTLAALPPEVVNYESAQFASLTPGYLLGEFKNYRLLESLGEGGMGQTWLAEELAGGEVVQKVVVKVLTRELCGNANALEEVRRVFELTSQLRHPNICATLGMKKDPAFGWFLVMDYADGGTLADWFKSQPKHENGLPLEKILPILRPIAEALDYAHRVGILHRDIKPQNIAFKTANYGSAAAHPTPILIDFGIAVRLHPESASPNAHSLGRASASCPSSTSGTPAYMAPEQMMGHPQTMQTDQYALAMVLYELLNGKLPFTAKNIAETMYLKTTFNPENPAFSESLNAALRRALSFHANERFSSCADFFNALPQTRFAIPAPPNVPSSNASNVPPAVPPVPPTLPTSAKSAAESAVPECTSKDTSFGTFQLKSNLKKPQTHSFKNHPPRQSEKGGFSSGSDLKIPPALQKFFHSPKLVFLAFLILPLAAILIFSSQSERTAPKVPQKNAAPNYFDAKLSEDGFKYRINQGIEILGYAGQDDSIKIPKELEKRSVTKIGESAFYEAKNLTKISLPATITNIKRGAFAGCSNLREIDVASKNECFASINGVLFEKEFILLAFPGGYPADKYIVPEETGIIADRAFYSSRLTQIQLHNYIWEIGEEAFAYCANLTDIRIPEKVTAIERSAFHECSKLASVELHDRVAEIGDAAFYGCSCLEWVTIPPSVTKIGNSAFAECPRLTILGEPKSCAEKYAAKNRIPFKAVQFKKNSL